MIPFSGEIRQTFFDFFKSKNHIYVPQSSILQPNDPTIMFTNSGMVQFKDIFLGNKTISDKRLFNSQLCLRVSGKHNDLDEVGVDTYHHTLFEMLGNWSIGDYFKKEIIEWAYELLIERYKLPKERIYVTVFGGAREDGLEKDDESYNLWKKIVPEDHIVLGSKKDNFWEMGEVGPCGPCSEIHVDLRDDISEIPGRELVNKDNPEVIEIWNLVFMQYERLKDGSLKLLNNHYVDTGMGFERLVRILQNKKSNYDTDLFLPYIYGLESIADFKYGVNKKVDIAMRVISDHIRAVAVAICDGVLPSNVKEGYVIRRILRRAIRYGYSFLGLKDPCLYLLINNVVSQYRYIKPEIEVKQFFIQDIIKQEEEDFLRTISRGIYKLDEIIKNNSKPIIDGRLVFELYDTFGFPADLTELILKENDLSYDRESFNQALQEQKQRSRAASFVDNEGTWTEIKTGKQTFIGYDTFETKTSLLAYREYEGRDNKILYHIILENNPFYGEAGGQVGDTGVIVCEGEEIKVLDAKKSFGITFIVTEKLPKNLNAEVFAKIDVERRKLITTHHSATHFLQATLRQILGNQVEQRGSYVCDKYLRFDFSCNDNMIGEKREAIEHLLNDKIQEGLDLTELNDVDFEEAKKMGAMCLFENKYGDKVRVIKFGDFSMELCGGTHVKNSKEIICCKIFNIETVARGIKRIEAVAGRVALNLYEDLSKKLLNIGIMLCNKKDPVSATKKLLNDYTVHENLLGFYRNKVAALFAEKFARDAEVVKDRNFVFEKLDLIESGLMRLIFNDLVKRLEVISIFETVDENKNILLFIGSSYKDIPANVLAQKVTENFADVHGGGNANFAMLKADKSIPQIADFVKNLIL